ncbi:hypothetical protein RclHR1_20400002 [Rhizophagus clarus]|uniref:Uncharacterized protein n=1 Tax=Rhizophagus clarus TaxID=94130 RepID=A0A2Z6R4L0_9GLOM|nr:hypothetical protein RclHR1_20400002 [Rhizophagus clarus]
MISGNVTLDIFYAKYHKFIIWSILTISNFNNSIPRQEFNLNYASEDDLTDSDEEVFELDSDFEEFTIRFSNALSEIITHEEKNDIEIEVYKGEYDSDIEAELEQVNVEHNFDNNQEEKDEIIPNDENEGPINQKYNALLSCVIIDNIHDQDAVQQANNDHLKLGVCDSHFLYDQNQIHDSKEKIFKEFTDAIVQHRRCIGYEETKKEEILKSIVKVILPFIPTSTKTTSSTLDNFKSDETPSLFIIQILFLDTPISNSKESDDINCEKFGRKFGIKLWKSREVINKKKDSLNSPESLLEYFHAFPDFITAFFQGLLIEIFNRKLAISNRKRKQREQEKKTLPENTIIKIVTFFASVLVSIAFPLYGTWLTSMLSSLARKPKLLSSLHRLFTIWNVIRHSERHERNLENKRINKVIPTQRLYQESNIWNLAIIDNIDFKQKTFSFGNIYDATRDTSHATLRMVFQSKIPNSLASCQEEVIILDEETANIFGMNSTTKEALNRFQNVLERLLDIQKTNEKNIEYNRNFDAETIKKKILAEFEYGCKGPSPHVVILEPADSPNSDQAILEVANMYRADFNLQENRYLDIVADEAIFRWLMRCQAQFPQLRPLLG